MRRYVRKKNSFRIFTTATFIAAIIFAFSYYFTNTKEDKGIAIAKIGNEKIFKREMEQKLRNIFDGQEQTIKVPEIENMPKEVIEILTKEIYLDKKLLKLAKKSAVTQNSETKARISEARDKILRQAYIDHLIKQEITDQKVNDKYAELTNELAGKKEYSISHIIVKSKDEAEKILKNLNNRKKPLKFFDAAKKYSLDQDSAEKGGELGYVLEDNVIKEIADILPTLKKDTVSAPIQTKFGWHLVKFSDMRDAKPLDFEAVKDNIRSQLTQDKINEINAGIIKNAKVELLIKPKETDKQKGEQKQSNEQQSPEEKQETKTEAEPKQQ